MRVPKRLDISIVRNIYDCEFIETEVTMVRGFKVLNGYLQFGNVTLVVSISLGAWRKDYEYT